MTGGEFMVYVVVAFAGFLAGSVLTDWHNERENRRFYDRFREVMYLTFYGWQPDQPGFVFALWKAPDEDHGRPFDQALERQRLLDRAKKVGIPVSVFKVLEEMTEEEELNAGI